MMFRAAIALIAFAVPAFAQHGGGHAGSFGGHGSFGGGFAGHSGFSGSRGFAASGSFARPAPTFRYGGFGGAGYRPAFPPNYSGYRIPYSGRAFSPLNYANSRIPNAGNRTTAFRPPYVRAGASVSRTRGREPYRRGRRDLNNGWVYNNYLAWPGYGYPWVIDPGFYDWSEPDDSDQAAAPDYGASVPGYPPPYAGEGYAAPSQPPAASAASAPLPEQRLTVIFKSDRAPVKVENYMMTAKVFTDLDAQHNEQIPLDQIDVTATQRANSAAGVAFQVPGAAGN